MKTKHTPGQWFVELENGVVDTIRSKAWGNSDQMADYRGNIICDLTRSHGEREHAYPEAEANAQLIAAAPELLEALQSIDERLKKCKGFPINTLEVFDSFYQEIVTEAIKKATV